MICVDKNLCFLSGDDACQYSPISGIILLRCKKPIKKWYHYFRQVVSF